MEGNPRAGPPAPVIAPCLGRMEERSMSVKVEDKLFLDRFNVDEESHLRLRDGKVCFDKCRGPALSIYLPGQCLQIGKRSHKR